MSEYSLYYMKIDKKTNLIMLKKITINNYDKKSKFKLLISYSEYEKKILHVLKDINTYNNKKYNQISYLLFNKIILEIKKGD